METMADTNELPTQAEKNTFFESSASIDKIAPALVAAQGEMEFAPKTEDNKHFGSKYADLAAYVKAVRGPLKKHGLSFHQFPSASGKMVTVKTIVLHTSGQWIGCEYSMESADNKPQSIGSTTTYARKYSLSSITGVAAEEDDDGNLASGRPAAPPSRSEIVDPKDPVSAKRYEQQVQSAKTALGQPRK